MKDVKVNITYKGKLIKQVIAKPDQKLVVKLNKPITIKPPQNKCCF